MTKQYLNILIDSLRKKDKILTELIQLNEEQTTILKQEKFDEAAFDANAAAKDKRIAALNPLDEGFESVFAHVQEELSDDQRRQLYKQEIQQLKELITSITEKSMTIQAGEQRNKQSLELYFSRERERIRNGRTGSKVAINYYNNMKNRTFVPPHFWDSKN
jgi:hypothetical protein